jgi:hypothetical protein
MSASYVRSKVEQWCEEAAQLHNVPFYKTINLDVDPQDDVWFTVEFIALFHEGMLCRKEYMEQGVVRVVFIGQPGIGWEDTIRALELIVPELMGKIDPTQRLQLKEVEPTVEESLGSAEPSYMVSAAINYQHNL